MRYGQKGILGGSLMPYTAVIRRKFLTPTGPFTESQLTPVDRITIISIGIFLFRKLVIIIILSLLGRLLILDYIQLQLNPPRFQGLPKCLYNSEVRD